MGMNITVFGANGMVGKLVVDEAVRRGHQVVAFVHSQNPFGDEHAAVATVQGDVTDPEAVGRAVHGTDAVISALGAFRRGTGPVLTPGMRVLAPKMEAQGLTRLVTLTGACVVSPGARPDLRLRLGRQVLRMMDATAVIDGQGHVDALRGSALRWTTVRAPTITPTGPPEYEFTAQAPSLLKKVPGPAVAAGLLDLAESNTWVGELPGIRTK